MIKNKFAGKDKEVPASEQFYSPLRIALHSTITISMIDWLTTLPELNGSMIMPTGNMTVIAIGKTPTGRDEIYNIYMVDDDTQEFTLQLFCSPNDKGQGMEFREGTLYREVRNVSPQSEDEWTTELNDVGNLTYTLDGHEYKRIWGGDSVSKVDLESFEETIIRMEESLSYTNNYVLYARDLTQAAHTQQELLLMGVEESEESAELVNRIGLAIPASAIKVQ